MSKIADLLKIRLSKNEILEWDKLRKKRFLELEELMPHALELLKFFREKKCKLAILTNTDIEVVMKRLEKFGIGNFFDVVLTTEDFGAKSGIKAFHLVLEKTGVGPEECIMIGDNPHQDMSSLKAGIKVILLRRPEKKYPTDTNGVFLVDSLKEIEYLFEKNFVK